MCRVLGLDEEARGAFIFQLVKLSALALQEAVSELRAHRVGQCPSARGPGRDGDEDRRDGAAALGARPPLVVPPKFVNEAKAEDDLQEREIARGSLRSRGGCS